jgi:hypothetical protein
MKHGAADEPTEVVIDLNRVISFRVSPCEDDHFVELSMEDGDTIFEGPFVSKAAAMMRMAALTYKRKLK